MPRKKAEKEEKTEKEEVKEKDFKKSKKEKQETEKEEKIEVKEKNSKEEKAEEPKKKKESKAKKSEIKESEEISEEKIKEKEQETLLVPLEEYIKTATHLGTRVITPGMREYVYRRKADGVAVMNTKKIDDKIEIAANFLSQYSPEDICVCSKRDAGNKALEAFGNALNARIYKKYMAGTITNSFLKTFFEPKIMFVVDPWLDKNALNDAVKIHIPVLALCSTNNSISNIEAVVPCNNKNAKSIGLILYIIAKLYLEKRKIKKEINAEDFYDVEAEKTETESRRVEREKTEMKRVRFERQKMGV